MTDFSGLYSPIITTFNDDAIVVYERIDIWRVCANILRGTGERLLAGTGVESTAQAVELATPFG